MCKHDTILLCGILYFELGCANFKVKSGALPFLEQFLFLIDCSGGPALLMWKFVCIVSGVCLICCSLKYVVLDTETIFWYKLNLAIFFLDVVYCIEAIKDSRNQVLILFFSKLIIQVSSENLFHYRGTWIQIFLLLDLANRDWLVSLISQIQKF